MVCNSLKRTEPGYWDFFVGLCIAWIHSHLRISDDKVKSFRSAMVCKSQDLGAALNGLTAPALQFVSLCSASAAVCTCRGH